MDYEEVTNTMYSTEQIVVMNTDTGIAHGTLRWKCTREQAQVVQQTMQAKLDRIRERTMAMVNMAKTEIATSRR